MTNQVATLNTDNFNDMARAMGMTADMGKETKAKQSMLPRLRIWNQAVMGDVEVKGKKKKMEVVPAGMFRLDLGNDEFIYSEQADVRVFVQRFMYKRYDADKRMYIKTLMAEDLKGDLKDNTGNLNCGKPAGYIEDFQALPDDMKTLIKQIKRVRVLLGEVTFKGAVDGNGEDIGDVTHPFIWEVENRDAFKTMGMPFTMMAKQKRLPVQHFITCGTEEHKLPTGASFFLPTAQVDLSNAINLTEEDQATFANFLEWINNYNDYIVKEWSDKRSAKLSAEDEDLVEDFIDIEVSED
jgi:hypothetical protein